jgi:hypothetical protein
MAEQAQAKILGPFEVIQAIGPEGAPIASIPFSKVRGSNLLISVDDNFGKVLPVTAIRSYWAVAEVSIIGRVQGVETLLKRQQVRMLTGPMGYVFDDAEAYGDLVVRARNMSGGRRGPPGPATASPDPTAANGFSITVTIAFQPRGGMGPRMKFEAGMG